MFYLSSKDDRILQSEILINKTFYRTVIGKSL